MDTQERRLVDLARSQGASIAGIAAMGALQRAPSQVFAPLLAPHSGVDPTVDGPGGEVARPAAKRESRGSVVVIGLEHPADRPELDWWDGRGTQGNRLLIDISKRIEKEIDRVFRWHAQHLHYYVERGGVYLKDAAVLAGLGCIGKNNLLVTPEYGPRVRLRGLYLAVNLRSTGPVAFNPCSSCSVLCRAACPERAFAGCMSTLDAGDRSIVLPAGDGAYSRVDCMRRMEKDETAGRSRGSESAVYVRYCRRCEFACPVGRTS